MNNKYREARTLRLTGTTVVSPVTGSTSIVVSPAAFFTARPGSDTDQQRGSGESELRQDLLSSSKACM